VSPRKASLWRATLAQAGPEWAAVRYVTLARLGAGRTDPAAFATTAREDVSRLATALTGVIDLHTADTRHRCQSCSAGTLLIDWPCPTRRAIEDGLRHGWPTPTYPAEPDLAPDSHEAFALAVLAVHDILPAAGGQPATCRACQIPPDRCPVWALAEGFLGITPTTNQPEPAGAR
jgi:hypothetical protein